MGGFVNQNFFGGPYPVHERRFVPRKRQTRGEISAGLKRRKAGRGGGRKQGSGSGRRRRGDKQSGGFYGAGAGRRPGGAYGAGGRETPPAGIPDRKREIGGRGTGRRGEGARGEQEGRWGAGRINKGGGSAAGRSSGEWPGRRDQAIPPESEIPRAAWRGTSSFFAGGRCCHFRRAKGGFAYKLVGILTYFTNSYFGSPKSHR